MPKGNARKTVRRRHTSRRTTAARNPCRSLVLIDQEPLRREALSECRKAMDKLEKERAKWRKHEDEDLPAFQRWYDEKFGSLTSELAREESLVREKLQLVEEVEFEFHYRGGGYRSAYRRVMDRRENPETEDGSESEGGASGTEDEEDPFRSFFRDAFGFDEDEMDEMFGSFAGGTGKEETRAPGAAPAGPAEDEHLASRVKERFRLLARKLHPDVRGGDPDARRKELWHEAQEAYRAGDLERLDTLLALCEVEEGEVTEATGLSLLEGVARKFRASLRTLRAHLRQARKDPAWGFSRRKDKRALAARMREELESRLEDARAERRQLEQLLAEWSRPPGRSRTAAGRKKPATSGANTRGNQRRSSRVEGQQEFSFR